MTVAGEQQCRRAARRARADDPATLLTDDQVGAGGQQRDAAKLGRGDGRAGQVPAGRVVDDDRDASWPAIVSAVRPPAPSALTVTTRPPRRRPRQPAADHRVPRQPADPADAARALAGERQQRDQQQRADHEGERRRRQATDRPAEVAFAGACIPTRPPTTAATATARPLSIYFASSQFVPVPASTASGGSRSAAPTISSQTISCPLGLLAGPLEQQLVVDLQDHARLRPAAASESWQRTIATLMMSAAVPWMIVLTASRSPSLRVCQLRARISGICRRRPNSVET